MPLIVHEFFTLLLVLPIRTQSPHLFTELSDYHTCCKTLDYKYWMPTLFNEITVLQNMD